MKLGTEMRKQFLLLVIIVVIISVGGYIIYNNQDIKTNTININPTNQPTEEISSQQPQQTIANTPTSPQKLFDKEFANMQYVKEEVSQEIFKDKVIFPDVDRCSIYVVEPIDIDTKFLLNFAYNGNMSKVKTRLKETDTVEIDKDSKFGGNYTGKACYEGQHVNLGYNKKDGSTYIFYKDILSGKNNVKKIEDNENSFTNYSHDFINNFRLIYDNKVAWIGGKNKNHHCIQKIIFEHQIDGINIFPGSVSLNKYNCITSGSSLQIMINTSGIAGFTTSNLCKIKELISDDVKILTFNKALEIYKNNSKNDYSYVKFYYCFDVVDYNHLHEVTDEMGTYNIYQSFEYKTTPVWIFFTTQKYDFDNLNNNSTKMIIDAQTGEIFNN
jgi:hypothetical protein